MSTFIAPGFGGLTAPSDLAFESDATLLVASGSGDILHYNSSGAFLNNLIPTGTGGLSSPVSLLIVPEPSSFTLLAAGLIITAAAARRRQR